LLTQRHDRQNGSDTLALLGGLGSDDTVELLQLLNSSPTELARCVRAALPRHHAPLGTDTCLCSLARAAD
jgi:hypothetical protein